MSCRLEADGGLFYAPIATVYSCFTECVGEYSFVAPPPPPAMREPC